MITKKRAEGMIGSSGKVGGNIKLMHPMINNGEKTATNYLKRTEMVGGGSK